MRPHIDRVSPCVQKNAIRTRTRGTRRLQSGPEREKAPSTATSLTSGRTLAVGFIVESGTLAAVVRRALPGDERFHRAEAVRRYLNRQTPVRDRRTYSLSQPSMCITPK